MKRQQRINAVKALYKKVDKDFHSKDEELYKTLKKNFDDKNKLKNESLDFIYERLENCISLTTSETKKIYESFKDDVIILEDLLYDKDGLTIEDRVEKWTEICDGYSALFYRLSLILTTEEFNLIRQIIKTKTEEIAFEILPEGDGCEKCSDYFGIYPIDELSVEPPFHPGCQCIVIGYDSGDDIAGDL